ncbi:MAG: type IVB secretion system protein IcmH/DotU [Legionellaceae bacterium]|nr:type IVB secretion system protein IcmH/DotU [Legionellaceae bacterium]
MPVLFHNAPEQGYYRSKLLALPCANHSIVSAAGPIFSMLDRLNLATALPPVEQICASFEHELRAYHGQISHQMNTYGEHSLATYLLCATVDELIGKNYLRLYQESPAFPAFTSLTLSAETPAVQFFRILEYAYSHPQSYLDILELAYHCLISGFEGQFHGQLDGRQCLDTWLENLYDVLSQFRAPPPPKVKKMATKVTPIRDPQKMLYRFGAIGVGLFLLGAWISHGWLEHQVYRMQLMPFSAALLEE